MTRAGPLQTLLAGPVTLSAHGASGPITASRLKRSGDHQGIFIVATEALLDSTSAAPAAEVPPECQPSYAHTADKRINGGMTCSLRVRSCSRSSVLKTSNSWVHPPATSFEESERAHLRRCADAYGIPVERDYGSDCLASSPRVASANRVTIISDYFYFNRLYAII